MFYDIICIRESTDHKLAKCEVKLLCSIFQRPFFAVCLQRPTSREWLCVTVHM